MEYGEEEQLRNNLQYGTQMEEEVEVRVMGSQKVILVV